jgi:hypothetical protein
MNAAELKAEMSIAGNPDKIMKLFDRVWAEIVGTMDLKSHPEHTNVMLILARMYAEVKGSQKRLEKTHSANILKQFERELKYDENI